MTARSVLSVLLVSALGLPVSAASASARPAEPTTVTAPAAVHAPPPEVARASREERARYAMREAKTPEARNYRAGDVIVISASAVAIVLLVVLLIVLL